jgi:hypothetical protein
MVELPLGFKPLLDAVARLLAQLTTLKKPAVRTGRVQREQEKGHFAFRVRREALTRIGLIEVRQHRLKRLNEEERDWSAGLSQGKPSCRTFSRW